ncbi:GST C-terminal domain-containing protein [Trichostrongylus colubriformis]|uniref:glutathione transferase n=1 Tax=Trichostrongylus colubriformis TaxID=6319 RepID=A0AAN8F757_TRICO
MPFNQVPVLEVDGELLPQSFAIVRYLARLFGYAGKNAWEEAVVDMIGDQFKDYLIEVSPVIRVVLGYDKGDVVKAHSEKIRSIPELKKWIETRPDTPF